MSDYFVNPASRPGLLSDLSRNFGACNSRYSGPGKLPTLLPAFTDWVVIVLCVVVAGPAAFKTVFEGLRKGAIFRPDNASPVYAKRLRRLLRLGQPAPVDGDRGACCGVGDCPCHTLGTGFSLPGFPGYNHVGPPVVPQAPLDDTPRTMEERLNILHASGPPSDDAWYAWSLPQHLCIEDAVDLLPTPFIEEIGRSIIFAMMYIAMQFDPPCVCDPHQACIRCHAHVGGPFYKVFQDQFRESTRDESTRANKANLLRELVLSFDTDASLVSNFTRNYNSALKSWLVDVFRGYIHRTTWGLSPRDYRYVPFQSHFSCILIAFHLLLSARLLCSFSTRDDVHYPFSGCPLTGSHVMMGWRDLCTHM
jgi:hypothetical protein